MNEKDPHRYDDIIDLPRFVSRNRKHMSDYDRAAQFSSFDALTGYDEAIEETGRSTQIEIFLSENEKEELDRRFSILMEHIAERAKVRITYFEPDLYKEGGVYRKADITVRKIDPVQRILFSDDGKRYELDAVTGIEGALFDAYEF